LTKSWAKNYNFPNYLWLTEEDSMAEGIVEVTSATWDKEILQAPGLVMVDFWAVWCGPCRIIAPTVEDLAKEYAGKVKVGKLNTDENPDVASKYKIMGIPTIIFFKNGEKVDQIVGAVPKPQLKSKIDALLGA
jgi:thioredoxin 1